MSLRSKIAAAVLFVAAGLGTHVVLAQPAAATPIIASGSEPVQASADSRGCVAGQALLDAEQTEAATSAFVSALRRDPADKCSQDALAALAAGQSPPDPCAIADALDKAGAREAAKTVVETAITDGRTLCPNDGKRLADRLSQLSIPSWGQRLDQLRDGLLTAAPWVLLAAVLLLVGKAVGRLRRPQVTFTVFGDPSTESKAAAETTAIALAHFHKDASTSTKGVPRMSVVESHVDAVDLPDLKAISPHLEPVGAAASLLTWAARPRQLTVTGQLHAPGPHGVGLTIQLARGRHTRANATFWDGRPEAGSDADLRALGIPAGAWAHRAAPIALRRRRRRRALNDAATADAVFGAWMRAGALASAEGNWDRALAAYDRALHAKPTDEAAVIARIIALSVDQPKPAKQLAVLQAGATALGLRP